MESLKIPSTDELTFQKAMKEQQEREKALRCMRYLLQTIKYLQGYLTGVPMEIRPSFEVNPMEVVIRVWWKDEERDVFKVTDDLRAKMDEMAREIAYLSKPLNRSGVEPVGSAEVSKPVADDGAG